MASAPIIKLPASAAQFSPLSLIRMLWLHKVAILVIWVIAASITAAVVYTLPVQYSAEVEILVTPQEIPEKMVQSVVVTNIQDRLATIEAQILSAAQLQKVIDDFGLYKKERKTKIPEEILQIMRAAISVKLEKGWTGNQPGAFLVSYTGDDPAVVTQVANRVGNLFIEENFRTRTSQVQETTEFLGTLLDDAKKRLDDSEAAIAAYKLKNNGELPEQIGVIAGTVSRLQTEQSTNRDAIARAEQAKMTIQNSLEVANSALQSLLDRPETAPVAVVRPDAPGLKQKAVPKESEVLEGQLAALRERGEGEQHPDVKHLKLAIAAAKDEEARAEQAAKAAPPVTPAPAPEAPKVAVANPPAQPPPGKPVERPEVVAARERVRTIQEQIDALDMEITTRAANQDKLAQAVEEAQARLTNVPVREQEIAKILRDHGNIEGEYQALLAKASTAKVSSDMEFRQKSERFTMTDGARPGKPVNPASAVYNLMGSVIGLALGCAFALGKEFHQGRLLGAWELPDEVLVLARVPQISPSRGPMGLPIWSRWSRTRRIAVVSSVLLPLLGLLAAARVYLVR
jgi:uncharacterized protein involved in exopolysaccharide biosynthesis